MSTIKQRLLEAIDRSPIAELENTLLFLENRLTLNQLHPDYPAKAVSILKQLAQINACANIEDPIAWQTELRTDRPLPLSNQI
jgi:hypothetical protein